MKEKGKKGKGGMSGKGYRRWREGGAERIKRGEGKKREMTGQKNAHVKPGAGQTGGKMKAGERLPQRREQEGASCTVHGTGRSTEPKIGFSLELDLDLGSQPASKRRQLLLVEVLLVLLVT